MARLESPGGHKPGASVSETCGCFTVSLGLEAWVSQTSYSSRSNLGNILHLPVTISF